LEIRWGAEVVMNELHHIDGHLSKWKLYLHKTETKEITEITEQFCESIGKHVDMLHARFVSH
jgi:hypothetical protein